MQQVVRRRRVKVPELLSPVPPGFWHWRVPLLRGAASLSVQSIFPNAWCDVRHDMILRGIVVYPWGRIPHQYVHAVVLGAGHSRPTPWPRGVFIFCRSHHTFEARIFDPRMRTCIVVVQLCASA